MTNKIKILLLATLFYTSCNSSKYPKSLVEIDSLCYSNPQLALTKLAIILIQLRLPIGCITTS